MAPLIRVDNRLIIGFGFLLTALSNTAIACAFIGGTARPGGLGFAPNGREPRLLMPRQSWRAVVMPHLLEAGRGDVIAPSIQIEEASVAIVGKALLVIPSRI